MRSVMTKLSLDNNMSPEQLYKDAQEAKKQGSHCGMSLVFSKGNKHPPGFPRGELLCETERGKLYSFSPDKVIRWLEKNGLIEPNAELRRAATGADKNRDA